MKVFDQPGVTSAHLEDVENHRLDLTRAREALERHVSDTGHRPLHGC